MSLQQFSQRLYNAKYGKNDKKWFPRWIKRYARSSPRIGDQLVVTEELVIGFCRELLVSRTPAWQRLQAVRAIEAYRNLMLGSKQPPLGQIRKKLEPVKSPIDDLLAESA